jgi:hypothetical protein
MGLIATAEKNVSDFKRVPAGSFIGRCFSVIDLGIQKVEWSGEVKSQHKIVITWELFGEDEEGNPLTVPVDGQEMPMTISKRYTLSLSEQATLRKDLESWRSKAFSDEELAGFDLRKLIDVYCMISVTHSLSKDGSKTYANVTAVTPIPSALRNSKPKGVHAPRVFEMDNPDMAVFASLSERMQATIMASPDWIDNKQSA